MAKITSLIQDCSYEHAEIVDITPEMAEEALSKNKHNRPLKPGRVQKHIRRIEANVFGLSNDAITFGKRGGLINGQNRLNACKLSGKPIHCLVLWGCPDKSFLFMDTGDKRSGSDTMAVNKIDNPNEVATAVRLLLGRSEGRGILGGSVDNFTLHTMFEDHPELKDSVEFIVKLNKEKDGFLKQLGNLGNFACLHYLMRNADVDSAKSFAKEFWTIVADVEEEGKERAPVRLRLKLLSDKKSATPLTRDSKIGIIVKAFLAFANKEKVSGLQCQKGEYPTLGGLDVDPAEFEEEEPAEEATPEPKVESKKKKKRKKKKPTVSDDSPPSEEMLEVPNEG